MMTSMRAGVVLLVLAAVPAAARGQVAWDGPLLLPPGATNGFGIYLVDMHAAGVGVLGTWRSSGWNYGLRLGLAEARGDEDLAIFGGIDFLGPIHRRSTDFPLDVDWLLGAGLGVDDGARVSVPVGLTAAFSHQTTGARFTPYITPRVHLDGFFGGPGDDDIDLGLAVDLGLDLRVMSGGLSGLTIRFGASLGDRDGIGLGLVF